MRKEIQDELNRSKEIRHEAEILLQSLDGSIIDLKEWVTIKEYARKYGESDKVIHNWIRRGIIPPDGVRVVKELNNIRLIRAIPYKEKA